MENPNKWLRSHQVWVELFALFNLAALAPDIFLAHSVNRFHNPIEYVPLAFSLTAPLALAWGVYGLARSRSRSGRTLGFLVGWTSVLLGITGLLLHLESQFFQQRTLASLVYAAPFAAPLAYTGIGLLLIMNRMVHPTDREWSLWVVFLAWGGFVGNFIFSLTDHAQNGFFYLTEWIPVVSSGLAVGFLLPPLLVQVSFGYLRGCAIIMLLQATVGLAGFGLHLAADAHGVGASLLDRLVYGAPIFAPLLFPDLVLLAGIGLGVLYRQLSLENRS